MIKFIQKTLILITVCTLSMLLNSHVQAQSNFERISVAERSDGLGYVIRHHFDLAPDSFQISQPDLYTLQVRFYQDSINHDNLLLPEHSIIDEIIFSSFDNGIGLEYKIREENYFLATVYFDQNQRDVLVPLQRTSQALLAVRAAESTAIFVSIQHTDDDIEDRTEAVEEVHFSEEISTDLNRGEQSKFTDILHESNPSALNRIPIGDPFELYMRAVIPQGRETQKTAFLSGRNTYYKSAYSTLDYHPWQNHSFFRSDEPSGNGPFSYRFYNAEFYMSNNSEIPLGQNDGALWQGRGNNYFLSSGAGAQYGPFTAVFRPQFVYSENLAFEEIEVFDISRHPRFGDSEYQMHLTYADLPLRFGDSSLSEFNIGDSFIQAEYSGLATGLSNERLWSGPAVHNPLIFSNHAPGFVHGFLRTAQPLNTRYGNIEFNWIWGRLAESDYFDNNPENDQRYITAFSVSYSPSFISGLHIGVTRAAYSYTGTGSFLANTFMAFRPSQPDHITDPEEAIFNLNSYYARWVFPQVNFEAYAEWGRHDYRRSFRDILAEPELNRAYVLGFLKNFEVTKTRRLLLNVEITKLENSSVTATERGFNTWYTNPVIAQGFTHKGRVLGAGIGPGSSTQQAHLHFYDRWGVLSVFGARIAHHMDRQFEYEDYFRSLVNFPEFYFLLDRHEIEMRYGFNAMIFLPNNLELELGYIIGNVENRFNLRNIDINNTQYSFTLRYNFSGFSR